MEYTWIIAVILVVMGICIYININLLLKIEALTDRNDVLSEQLLATSINIQTTLSNMQTIDSKGGFESDDEVGSVFDALKTELHVLENV